MDFDSPCDVIGTTIQPVPLAASAQPFRGGLKETNIIPMMTIDLKTAFPTSSSSSAFKPLAAASNHVTKVIIIISLFFRFLVVSSCPKKHRKAFTQIFDF
jgi:hypothetical protein